MDRQELQKKYRELTGELSKIKERLKKASEQKEAWFLKKENLKKQINELIVQAKLNRDANDKKDFSLGEIKKQRDLNNQKVQKLIERIKSITNEQSSLLKKFGIKSTPEQIQKKINDLEQKIEIEVNFKKEQKMMEEIKKLKKTYDESSEIKKFSDESQQIEKEIKEVKAKADEFHNKLRDMTKDKSYRDFMKLSKKITRLKKVQEDAFQKFIDSKNDFLAVQKELKLKQKEISPIRKELFKEQEEKREAKQQAETKIIREKQEEAETKLKTKKRLTTEDLMAFQRK